MALNLKLSNAAASAACDATCALLNSGYLRIYDGAQPADANTAITTQVMLAELRYGATAFAGAVNGVATANAITSAVAAATGTAAWFRALKSDGTTAVIDGTVGTATSDMIVPTTSIVASATVSGTHVHTQPKA